VNEQPEREEYRGLERDRDTGWEREGGRKKALGGWGVRKVDRRKQKVPMLKSAKHSVPVFKNVFNNND